MPIHDVVIIGSGPAGYTAAIYTARAGLKPIVLAGEISAGGALMNTTEVENYPGFPAGIMGPDLMENFCQQAQRFGAQIHYQDVVEADLVGEVKTVTTDEATYQAKRVIIATGSAHRELGVPGESEYSGRGVSYCATCDGFFFKDKQIAVVGGGDSAMEEATFLTRFAEKVYVIHRRDELRASKIMAKRAQDDPKIEFVWNSRVTKVHGEQGKMTALTLESTVDGSTSELPVSGVFVAIGLDPRSEIFKGQIKTDEAGYITVEEPTTKTSIAGVFACGDVVDSHYQQAVTAAGSGCRAAIDLEKSLP